MEKTIRIYSQSELTNEQKINLFWIRKGYFYHGLIRGDRAARALRILQEFLPEGGACKMLYADMFAGAEEAFYVESRLPEATFDLIVSVRQIGNRSIGNVRLWSRRLRKEFA